MNNITLNIQNMDIIVGYTTKLYSSINSPNSSSVYNVASVNVYENFYEFQIIRTNEQNVESVIVKVLRFKTSTTIKGVIFENSYMVGIKKTLGIFGFEPIWCIDKDDLQSPKVFVNFIIPFIDRYLDSK